MLIKFEHILAVCISLSSQAIADRANPRQRELMPSQLSSLQKRFEGDIDTTANPPFDVAPLPRADNCPLPGYPDSAKTYCSNLITGAHGDGPAAQVRYYVFVGENGEVTHWQRITEQPEGMGFGFEADLMIGSWRFQPATYQGRWVGTWTTAVVNFPEFHVIVNE